MTRRVSGLLCDCDSDCFSRRAPADANASECHEPAPVGVLAGSLINELDELERDFIAVLDDYHAIHERKSTIC